MYNDNGLVCYVSNVGNVWFYTIIITIVLTVFYYLYVLFLYFFVISPVTGCSDLLELNKIQYNS